MGMEFDARCDDGEVTCDNNVLRLYDGNVACLAAMPLMSALARVLVIALVMALDD